MSSTTHPIVSIFLIVLVLLINVGLYLNVLHYYIKVNSNFVGWLQNKKPSPTCFYFFKSDEVLKFILYILKDAGAKPPSFKTIKGFSGFGDFDLGNFVVQVSSVIP